MDSNNYKIFFVGKGETIVDGKSHWKDFIQVHIDDSDEAFRLALNILRQIEVQNSSERKRGISFSLAGVLESEPR